MFVNRTAELTWLKTRWRAKDAQLRVVYGKRRVGKTALLRKCLQGKPGVYILADRRPEREQLREPRNYLAILRAISQGRRKLGEIANDTGMAKNVLHKYLHVLEDLQLVERDVPITEKTPQKSRRSLYGLQDPFVAFWFACGYPYVSDLELGETRPALRRARELLPHLFGRAYERIAREALRRSEGLPFPLHRVGRWWVDQAEIDVVGTNDEANAILFGEVKWSERPIGTDIYRALTEKARGVTWGKAGRREAFALFSRTGFTPKMWRVARQEDVLLFVQDELAA